MILNEEVKNQAKSVILSELDEIVSEFNLTKGTPGQPDQQLKDQIGRRDAFPRWFVNTFYPLESEQDVDIAISMGKGGDYECDFFFILILVVQEKIKFLFGDNVN